MNHTLKEFVKSLVGICPQAINTSTLTKGEIIDRTGFRDSVAILTLGGFTPSNTSAISSVLQMQESDTATDGGFSDVTEAVATNVIGNNRQTLTADINFAATHTCDLSIDGVAMAQVPYNTSHDQTMADIVTAINAISGVKCTATCPGSGSKVITLTSKVAGHTFEVSHIVTAGTTPPTITLATATAGSGENVMELGVNLEGIRKKYIRFNLTHTITGGGSALNSGATVLLGGAGEYPI
jgi:hypothetical protein